MSGRIQLWLFSNQLGMLRDELISGKLCDYGFNPPSYSLSLSQGELVRVVRQSEGGLWWGEAGGRAGRCFMLFMVLMMIKMKTGMMAKVLQSRPTVKMKLNSIPE